MLFYNVEERIAIEFYLNAKLADMMMYFYSNGHGKEGPVLLDELKQKDINPKTLIWHEGLDEWKEAETIDELRDVFELLPPPIEIESTILTDSEREDVSSFGETTSKNYSAKKQGMFANPFSFQGRIRRLEYGLSLIIFFFLLFGLEILLKLGIPILISLARPVVGWFFVAQSAKRCHDLGRSGWYQIIPFYIFLLIFEIGASGRNKYGMNPKG
jgi:uncharacterized membrane protein YhaH (DUF805 family)